MDLDPLSALYALLAAAAAIYLVRWTTNPLNSIPTMGGPSAPILSYWTAYNYLKRSRELITEGYNKYHGSAFKVALLNQWLVVVSGPKMIDELRKRPEEELSMHAGTEEFTQARFSVGDGPHDDPYHVDLVKEKLMRMIATILPDVVDELKVAIPDNIPANGDEWVSVNVGKAAAQIIARASNRVFVGLPSCRNPEYVHLSINVTMDIIKVKEILNIIPIGMKRFVSKFLNIKQSIQKGLQILKPVLNERRAKLEEYGDNWPEKPNDMLQWLLEEAIPRNHTDADIVARVLIVNFAAIHTSSSSMTQALYHLAGSPECLQPLREEIESIIAAEGWTKTAMTKMWKVDSFLRESQRMNGHGLTTLTRKAMQDVTLNDGTFIPKGTLVAAASYATHHDETNYSGASVFDPFRFARMREAAGEGTKHQLVNTSMDFIPFGHGRSACPGRFFAANTLKAMLALIVLNYDLKVAGNGQRPENIFVGGAVLPDPAAKIMFRKRQVSA